MIELNDIPAIDATLNAITVVLLLCGYRLIKAGREKAHERVMLAATFTSVLFLGFYVTYHLHAEHTRYQGEGWIRPVYFFVLITHVVLAAVNLPMVLTTLWRAYRGDREGHRRIARITFPIWLYVSVTGILVYVMLYVMGGRGPVS